MFCRYQCDGFFTGAKPPWYSTNYESVQASELPKAELETVPVNPKTVPAASDWKPVWKAGITSKHVALSA